MKIKNMQFTHSKFFSILAIALMFLTESCKEHKDGGEMYDWRIVNISDANDIGVNIQSPLQIYIEVKDTEAELTLSTVGYSSIWEIVILENENFETSKMGFSRDWGNVSITSDSITFKFENFHKQSSEDDIIMYVWGGDAMTYFTIHRI